MTFAHCAVFYSRSAHLKRPSGGLRTSRKTNLCETGFIDRFGLRTLATRTRWKSRVSDHDKPRGIEFPVTTGRFLPRNVNVSPSWLYCFYLTKKMAEPIMSCSLKLNFY